MALLNVAVSCVLPSNLKSALKAFAPRHVKADYVNLKCRVERKKQTLTSAWVHALHRGRVTKLELLHVGIHRRDPGKTKIQLREKLMLRTRAATLLVGRQRLWETEQSDPGGPGSVLPKCDRLEEKPQKYMAAQCGCRQPPYQPKLLRGLAVVLGFMPEARTREYPVSPRGSPSNLVIVFHWGQEVSGLSQLLLACT
ncbi:hypothetical protein NDU88_010501 [Pleurodeles waltl]|uniref:Uncharacterized protein n=1 Tax=Pleurodeles waltl TaxID=8319 RepID=A0AAV7PY97_PLEWA|nr:hypothetical protein NDU88_010501 [Pleurodeles waltl]